jgi:predicted RNase H-like nuclease
LAHVTGVDGCRGGWCAVSIHDEGSILSVSLPAIYRSFQEVLDSPADLISIDIPIGLLDGPGQRPCDTEARTRLGWPRRNSVFTPPSRPALRFRGYASASQANSQASGRKLSKQTFAIMPKIAEVDSLMTPTLQSRVREVHPEVCFWALNNRKPMSWNKKKPAGRAERWRILRRVLPSLPVEPALSPTVKGQCAVDVYIGALVAAWTAVCIARGSAGSIPHNPTVHDRGLRMEIWFPAV